MHVEFDKAINLDYNTECAAITYANVLLTWAVSNPVYVVYMIYDMGKELWMLPHAIYGTC